ncbi:MAG: four helix bundle protein [Pyrinomonadaceae bacterium]
MATFKRFEDIQVWQKARAISVHVYRLTGDGEFSKDFDLRRQIRRSASSIMSNIAEGQGRRTDRDFANFLNIALGSVTETKSHLYLALDLGYIHQDSFRDSYDKLDEIGRMIFGLISHLRAPETSKTSQTVQTS